MPQAEPGAPWPPCALGVLHRGPEHLGFHGQLPRPVARVRAAPPLFTPRLRWPVPGLLLNGPPEVFVECMRERMSTSMGNKRGLPRPWVQSPQFTDGQMRPRFFCLSQSLCEPPLGLDFPICKSGGWMCWFWRGAGPVYRLWEGPVPLAAPRPPPSPEGNGAGVEAATTSLPSLHTPKSLCPAPRPATPEPAQLHVLSSSLTHCSARNIPIQVAREMTALPGDQAVAQNKLQPSFLLAALTQVRRQTSQEMARLCHTSPSGAGTAPGLRGQTPSVPGPCPPNARTPHCCYKPEKPAKASGALPEHSFSCSMSIYGAPTMYLVLGIQQ